MAKKSKQQYSKWPYLGLEDIVCSDTHTDPFTQKQLPGTNRVHSTTLNLHVYIHIHTYTE